MRTDKTRYDAEWHADPQRLMRDQTFRIRASLRTALTAQLEPAILTRLFLDPDGGSLLAQRLAFLPLINAGWGPTASEIERVACQLVACYLAHVDAFILEGFVAPGEAAMEALKDFDFSV